MTTSAGGIIASTAVAITMFQSVAASPPLRVCNAASSGKVLVSYGASTDRLVTGDWNGGERVFNLRPYHRLSDLSIARLDPATGQSFGETRR